MFDMNADDEAIPKIKVDNPIVEMDGDEMVGLWFNACIFTDQ